MKIDQMSTTLTPTITPSRKTLRVDYFKTVKRPSNRGLVVRYTNTINDPRIDAAFLDWIDARKKYFGLTFHYVITTDGTIEIGRDPETISSAGKHHYHKDHIVIGVAGGLDVEGNQVPNETAEQEASLEWLMQALADTLQEELEVTDNREHLQKKYLEEQQGKEQEPNPFDDITDEIDRTRPKENE